VVGREKYEGGWLKRNMEQEEGANKRLAEGGNVRYVRIHM